MYLAIEPFVRKRWPHALIGWNRILEGRWKDPLVGRDLLVGVLFAAGLSLIRTATLLLEVMSPMLPEADVLNAMHGNAHAVSFILAVIFDSANIPLGLFFLFCFFRIVFRNSWIAAGAFFILINAFVNLPSQSFSPSPEVSGVMIGSLFCSLWLLAVTRFGLVSGMSMWFADRIFRAAIMVNPSGWHAERMYLLFIAVGMLAVYAFIISVGNRPIVSTKLLDQHS
jgi:serine/threonine-protein kinase